MPRWASESDSTAASVIERWKQTAADEVDDIGGWREDPNDRIHHTGDPTCEWGEMPNGFYSRTSYLVGWITTHYPKLDPNPLQDIYIAVLAWYEDHNAKRIPPQRVLFATLERAMLVVNAVEMDIHSRVTKDSANLSDSSDGPDTKRSVEDPSNEASSFRVRDPLGVRTLIVPLTEPAWSGDPTGIVLDIEAQTRTRLRDGGNPNWFIRLHKHFQDRNNPADGVSFAAYVRRRHADKIDTQPADQQNEHTQIMPHESHVDGASRRHKVTYRPVRIRDVMDEDYLSALSADVISLPLGMIRDLVDALGDALRLLETDGIVEFDVDNPGFHDVRDPENFDRSFSESHDLLHTLLGQLCVVCGALDVDPYPVEEYCCALVEEGRVNDDSLAKLRTRAFGVIGRFYLKLEVREQQARLLGQDRDNCILGELLGLVVLGNTTNGVNEEDDSHVPVRERFSFAPGQALFDEEDLSLPSGLPVEVLQKLVDSFGRTVRHQQLHEISKESEASEELRGAVSTIRKRMKDKRIPCQIKSKRSEGYSIQSLA